MKKLLLIINYRNVIFSSLEKKNYLSINIIFQKYCKWNLNIIIYMNYYIMNQTWYDTQYTDVKSNDVINPVYIPFGSAGFHCNLLSGFRINQLEFPDHCSFHVPVSHVPFIPLVSRITHQKHCLTRLSDTYTFVFYLIPNIYMQKYGKT